MSQFFGGVKAEAATSGQAVVSYAKQFLGRPYVYGASGPNSFDCSGLTSYVYKNAAGINIGRTTYDQIKSGLEVSRSNLQPGDLVFTSANHVGIYVGDNKIIHSPQTGDVVKISNISSFWRARRIINSSSTANNTTSNTPTIKIENINGNVKIVSLDLLVNNFAPNQLPIIDATP